MKKRLGRINHSILILLLLLFNLLFAVSLSGDNSNKPASVPSKNNNNNNSVQKKELNDDIDATIHQYENPSINDQNNNVRRLLRAHLLKNYDKYAHPREDHNRSVKVGFGMGLLHLDVNEVESTLDIHAWMRITWVDDHLKWNPEDFGDLQQIHFGDGEIWKPDVFLYNNADFQRAVDPYGKTHFLVDNQGKVLWVPPAHLKSFCTFDLKFWPMDSHKCSLIFGSWTSHGNQIDLELYHNNSKVDNLNYYTLTQWKLTDSSAKIVIGTYSELPEKYPDVTFTFTIERKSPAYRAIIILPCLVIMLMACCSFALPPFATEKIILNSLALVISSMFLIYFATILPFQSNDVPIIVMFYSNTVALIGIAILLNVICISLATVRKHSSPSKFFRYLFSGPIGKFLCLGHYYHQISSTHRVLHEMTDMAESDQNNEDRNVIETPDSGSGDSISSHHRHSSRNGGFAHNSEGSAVMKEWILVAAGLERICLIIYAMAFAIVTSVYV